MSTALETEPALRLRPETARLPALLPTAPGATRLFFNRELSLLEFHRRVLDEGLDRGNPILERLKFLAIFSANLDEFFMIRVSGLKEELEGSVTELSPDGMTPAEQLQEIRASVFPMLAEQASCLREQILPELAAAGIHVVAYDELETIDQNALRSYFMEKVFPILTPLAVDQSHPFPYISPLSLNLGLMVEAPAGHSPGGSETQASAALCPHQGSADSSAAGSGRKIRDEFCVAGRTDRSKHRFTFPGNDHGKLSSLSSHSRRRHRNSRRRSRGPSARDSGGTAPAAVWHARAARNLCRHAAGNDCLLDGVAKLTTEDVYVTDGPLNLQDFMSLYDLNRADLKDEPFRPALPQWHEKSIFDALKERDILLHHPYDSYDSVTNFINDAVDDPDVVAIKICLYRTGPESPIPPALIRAAEKGKQVTALIEIKARFDEEHNIEWARKLDEAGVHVVYGILGLKTHGKLTLVVRREGDSLKRYMHIASGNYNPTTSCTYTDVGLFTADDEIGADATELFNYLTGCSRQTEYRKLLVAPVNLREKMNALIDREISHANAGESAYIVAKINRLADKQIIEKLYEASQRGGEDRSDCSRHLHAAAGRAGLVGKHHRAKYHWPIS